MEKSKKALALVGDIGGTHARFSLELISYNSENKRQVDILRAKTLATPGYKSFTHCVK